MSREPKGFFVSLPSLSNYRYHDDVYRGISFQLTRTGARYFFVLESPREKKQVRDISTQYRSLNRFGIGHLWLGEEGSRKAHERLITHARAFYPESVIPEQTRESEFTWAGSPYPWVAFPMLGAAMKGSVRFAPEGVNLQIASGLRALSLQDMTATIFGEAPKQLQAAAAASMTKHPDFVNVDNLTLASLLRGYLPPNELTEVLRMDLGRDRWIQQTDKHSANSIRLLLRRFNPHRIMRIVESVAKNPARGHMLLRDAANQYAEGRKNHPSTVMDLSRQFKSVEELHESITREFRKLAYANEEIQYSDELTENLQSIVLPGGAKLIWPSCTHELMDWASDKAMNNCIYSYGKDAVSKRCLLLAVLDSEGKMIINIMVRGGDVTQCYGKANQMVTDEALLEAVFKGLIETKIVNPENSHTTWLSSTRMW